MAINKLIMLKSGCNFLTNGFMMDDGKVNFFEIFPWNDNFETGIDLIDEQHKVLVEILNRLAVNLANLSEDVVLNEIFDELASYAEYHFKAEEAIWDNYFKDEEWSIEHKLTHGSFIDDVIAIKRNDENRTLDDVVYEIVSFLSKWLAYHILDTDKRLALAVAAIESGSSIEDAKTASADKMKGSMQVIIETVLTMYNTLSTRTLDLMREKALRIQAEEKLKLSEERWKFILDGGSNSVWDLDIENNKLNKSSDEASIFDVVGDNIYGVNESSRVHPADIEKIRADFQAHLDGKTEFYSNKHMVLRDNSSWSWVLSRGKVVSRDSDGKAVRIVGTHSDITERELAALIYNNSSQAIFICNSNNEIISVNPAVTKVTGYTQEYLIGKNPSVLSSGKHDKKFYEEMWKSINSSGYWSGEIYNKRKNGEIYPEYLEINVVSDANGGVDHYFALSNDISEKKQYKQELDRQEAYLLQQSRMIQMGEMISMIAHQWRQPLGAISANSIDLSMKIALESFDLSKEAERIKCKNYFTGSLNHIDMLVQNLSTTINDFRDFYKPNKEAITKLVNLPIVKALSIIKTSLEAAGVEIIEKYDCEDKVTMYENELIQVILNIFKNSQDNFTEKKTDKPKIVIETKKMKNSIMLKIYDNGGGIPENIIGKIFDPYFSTKNEKNGTGLGLYMSKIIVEKHHNARLKVDNVDGGVCFTVEFF